MGSEVDWTLSSGSACTLGSLLDALVLTFVVWLCLCLFVFSSTPSDLLSAMENMSMLQ